ncbi:hypothetical protein [Gloeothece verrucosa]|uniref:Uncharacterized protein n=1 Tax=Gloeothece verrucosa (strain PCC 7822) TaxID=497965 RepID=E0ULR5_GLOV7|nr:hypothetical protein [Gloeothece verrucosa]ADN17895.1 hypothetical protein Cyan7822_6049 [Gloeothece verrucosa PCC 7822]
MSILSLPRLYFTGEIFWNPDTANNTPDNYNESTNEVTTPLPQGVTYETYKQYMMTYQQGKLPGDWNYFGDHACNFVDYDDTLARKTKIVGGTLPDGRDVTVGDPIIGKGVQILGNAFNAQKTLPPCRLVDVDPYSVWSSQIFFNRLAIGDEETGIQGPRYQRMYSYWVGKRSLAPLPIAGTFSVIWQTAIPFEGLTINNPENSALLAALIEAMQQPKAQGLMIRFSTYRTLYYQNGIRNKYPYQPRNNQELSQLYLQGKLVMNPAYSLVTGSIGIWNQGEPATAPGGRYLVASNPVTPPNSTQRLRLKPALAQLDPKRKTLSLDFLDTIPEIDKDAHKADFGPLKVQVINPDQSITDIATLYYKDYNKQAYEARAGIIDLKLKDEGLIEKIEKGCLALSVSQGLPCDKGVQALLEEPYTAISDDRGVYIEQGETKSCLIQVQYKGKPAPAGTKLLLAQYDNDNNGPKLIDPNGSDHSTSSRSIKEDSKIDLSLLRAERTAKAVKEEPSGRVNIPTGTVVEVGEDGTVKIDLQSVKPGCCNLGLFPFGSGGQMPILPNPLNTEYNNYITIRAMPFDNDLDSKPDEELNWEFIYNNIFRVYNLIYPVMSEVLPLDDRTLIEGAWMQMKAVSADDMFESTLYMSVTRDLSAGKRRLLNRWCDLVSRDAQP